MEKRDPRLLLAAAVLAVIATVAALHVARGFFVPLLIGILASYALRPLVDRLQVWRVPRSIGAALALLLVVGSLAWIGATIGSDADALIEKLPDAARKLRHELSATRTGAPTALQNMQAAAKELQGAAADAGAAPAQPPKPDAAPAQRPKPRAAPAQRPTPAASAVVPQEPEPTWLRDYTLEQSALLASVAAQTPIVLLLAYFLLASGAHFRRKLVELVGPSPQYQEDAVRILDEIDTQIQRYLLGMCAANILLGLVTWLAFLALGMNHAGVWGVAAGVLHFIPYLGPALLALGSGVAAFLQSGSALYALSVAGTSLLAAGIVGVLILTWLQSRAARLNAAVLFIALLFFGWLWGVWGLLLGAPLTAIAKAVCDRVESLKAVGALLGASGTAKLPPSGVR